jgi:drug/metabolite transporter (DMT)-like permease
LNGSISIFLLDDRMPAERLAELRALGTFVALAAGLAITRPALLRIRRHDIGRLGALGIVGLALNSACYFAAIGRLDVGVALTIQYLGPLLLLLWLKLVHRRALPGGLWAVAALSAIGCFLVVGAYHPGGLDGVGIAEAFGAGITFAFYLYSAEKAGHRYQPLTILAWGFGMASVFWLIVQPLWSFPIHILSTPRNAAFAAFLVVGGTIVPFVCIIASVRHLPAPRAAIVATLEPVLGALLAWPIHDQALSALQITGGLVTVGAIVWVQSQRPELEAELAPEYRAVRRPTAPVE